MNRCKMMLAASALLWAGWSGCGGGEATPAAKTAVDASASEQACPDYAKKLCEALGAQSESCASSVAVVALLPSRACAAGLEEFATTATRIVDLRKACQSVAEHVCAEVGQDSDSCRAITQNLPEIPPGHCMSLARDEEKLIAALREREAATASVSDERWQELVAGMPPGFGAPEASVVLVEFTDFQCPFCAQAAETMRRLKQDYAGKIRVVLRQFPLPFHPDARPAARAALAAHDQGRFWQYHDLLFANQSTLGSEALIGYAKQAGLSPDKFKAAAQGESTEERVEHDIELGRSVHVQGTPTMFLNKKRVADPIDYQKIAGAIDAALAQTATK
jgi:protein-disulfide isomerase